MIDGVCTIRACRTGHKVGPLYAADIASARHLLHAAVHAVGGGEIFLDVPMSHRDAIVQTFRDVGKPTFITSLVLCLGFGVLVLGSIRPTQYFGILSAFAMLIAPFGDYLMLPALILIFKPKVKK